MEKGQKALTGPEPNSRETVVNDGQVPPDKATNMSSMQNEVKEKEEDMAMCIRLLKRRVHYLPIFTTVFIIASLFISYGVAVAYGHVEPDFPFISYTAVELPERCIFGQLINIGAFLFAANVYVRFLQQSELFKPHGQQDSGGVSTDRRLCIASLVLGWLSAFGLSMVANFQAVVMEPPHFVGAGLFFVLGLIYCGIQTSISLRHHRHECVTAAQVVNSIILTICLVIFAISHLILRVQEAEGVGTREDVLRPVYLVSTISEWLMAGAMIAFLLTFSLDFSKLTLQAPRAYFTEDRVFGTDNGQRNQAIRINSIAPV